MSYSYNISQCHSAALRLEQITQLSIHSFLLCSKISLRVSFPSVVWMRLVKVGG